MRTAEMKSSEECSSQLWTQCIPEKKKEKTGSLWSPEFFSDFLRNYINWLHNFEDYSLLEWNVNHWNDVRLFAFQSEQKNLSIH